MPYTLASYLPLPALASNASTGSTIPTILPSDVSLVPGGSSPSSSPIKYSRVSPAGKSASIAFN